MVGGIAVIASIVRLYALWVYTTTKDVSYDAIYVSKNKGTKEIMTNMFIDPSPLTNRSQRSHYLRIGSSIASIIQQDFLVIVQPVESVWRRVWRERRSIQHVQCSSVSFEGAD
jgi:hypothetical protein